jgi:hypothetical protein
MTRATFCACVYTSTIAIDSNYRTNFLVAELEGSKQLKPQVLTERLPDPASISFIFTNRLSCSILPSRALACLLSQPKKIRETGVSWLVRSDIC